MSTSEIGIEKKIIATALVFVLALTGVIALSVRMFGIDLPTCLTDVRPFSEGKVLEQAPGRYEIHYLARMWRFEPPEIWVRPGSTADIYLATADVTHGMQIVGTNVNLMAVPGAVNLARVRFDRPGDYLVVCNEYCGVAHHNMAGVIHVTDKAPPAPPTAVAHEATEPHGEKLMEKYGCTACHSIDGTEGIGPTLKGLYGSKQTLADGSTATADDAYLAESLQKPGAKIVKGFEDMMPAPEMTPAEVNAMVEYLKTLK